MSGSKKKTGLPVDPATGVVADFFLRFSFAGWGGGGKTCCFFFLQEREVVARHIVFPLQDREVVVRHVDCLSQRVSDHWEVGWFLASLCWHGFLEA